MYNSIAVGNRLIYARKLKNLTQIEVARLINVKQSAYSDIENGKRILNGDEIFKLAKHLDISVKWLLGIDNDNEFTDEELLKIEHYKRYIKYIRENPYNF